MATVYFSIFIVGLVFCFYYAFVKRNRFRSSYEDGEIQDLTTPIFLKKGYKIWEGNLSDGEVQEAQIVPNQHGVPQSLKTIVVKEHCIYVVAINKHNAERKIIDKLEKRLGRK